VIKFFFGFFFLLVLSCQSTSRLELESFQVQYKSLSQNINTAQSSGLFQFVLDPAVFFITSFQGVDAQDMQRLIERRKKNFVDIFVDDQDPYTGRKYLRSRCLKKVSAQAVEFESGAGNLWSDCALSQNLKAEPAPALRLWKICGRTLWEVTVKSQDVKEMSFSCL
jgi:hypothetical protein